MSGAQSPSGDTSNDVMFLLEAILITGSLKYRIIGQSETDLQDIQNAPTTSMSCFIPFSD